MICNTWYRRAFGRVEGLIVENNRRALRISWDYAAFVTEHGLGFRPIGGSFKKIVESDLGRQWIESGDSLRRYLDLSRRVFEPLLATWMHDAHEAVLDADVVLFHSLARGALDCAEKRGVPAIGVSIVPVWPCAEQCMFFPRAPWGWLRRWPGEQTVRGICKLARASYDEHRRKLGLTAFRTANPLREMLEAGVHFLYLYSRHIGLVSPEWPDNLHVTGACTLDTTGGWTPPKELLDFLSAGPPPVYVGFGSMTGRSPDDLGRLALEAVALAQQRAVVVTGWGGIASAEHRDDVLFVDGAPHEWLFPRCSAVVHHGGAGTVTAGLAAGKPTLVTAFFGDQPFWGYRVEALGAGPAPILRRDMNARRLADAIRHVVSEERYRRSAEKVATALQAEDGVANAVAAPAGLTASLRRCAS
jgi:sterol 3beta-glucosyltransferase